MSCFNDTQKVSLVHVTVTLAAAAVAATAAETFNNKVKWVGYRGVWQQERETVKLNERMNN